MTTIDHAPPTEDRYMGLDALVEYSGLSLRTLERYLRGPKPIPHFKLGKRIMVRRSDFDRWMEQVATPDHVARARTHAEKVADAVRGVVGKR